MSRFVEVLHQHEREISVESFRLMLTEMTRRLDATTGHIEMSFPYFVMKTAPVSGVASLMNYEASLIGEIHDGREEMWMQVVVPVTSLCPCSKRISERGAHNQRSHITIKARVNDHLWLEELIDIAEQEASSELFGILKRPTRSTSPSAPTTTPNSSRTSCATSPCASTPSRACWPTWWKPRTSSPSTITRRTR